MKDIIEKSLVHHIPFNAAIGMARFFINLIMISSGEITFSKLRMIRSTKLRNLLQLQKRFPIRFFLIVLFDGSLQNIQSRVINETHNSSSDSCDSVNELLIHDRINSWNSKFVITKKKKIQEKVNSNILR